jgi:deoxycytidylate deaminase
MKTIDTTKPWVVNPETDLTVPEICGPAGICMDVHGATTEQAQEIADMLNPLACVEGQLAEFRAPYSVEVRQGDCEVIYNAPNAEEAIWMMKRADTEVTGDATPINISVHAPDPEKAADALTRYFRRGDETPAALDESTTFVMNGRQYGKTHSMLQDAYARLNKLTSENERLKAELRDAGQMRDQWQNAFNAATERFEQADHESRTWQMNAASYLRSMHWYQEQLDRCGRALGVEAFTCDDGGKSDTPLRAKVAELVEQVCFENAGAKGVPRSQVHELIAGAIYSFAGGLTTRAGILTVGSACDAAPMAEEADKFCKRAGLVGEPDVRGWSSKIALFLDHAEQTVKRGPCAKQTVTATIVTPTGERFVGTNDCANPQTTCPRDVYGYKTGEGYHLCEEVCRQTGHAEVNALRAAGEKARGATMHIEGHTYACGPCQESVIKAGVKDVFFQMAPAQRPNK